MTNVLEKIEEIAAAVRAMPEVEDVKVWASVRWKERIYVDVIRTDREGDIFGGSGGTCYIDLTSGRVIAQSKGYNGSIYINSFTKSFHTERGTTDKIRAIIAAI